jgi:tetratricopeptide (TPR) repeat protein
MFCFVLSASLLATATLPGCGLWASRKASDENWPPPSERGEEHPSRRAASGRSASPAPRRSASQGETVAPGTPFPPVAPSPLETIDAATPPQVATATRLANEGRTQLTEGQDDAALETLERAISVDPSNAYAYYFLAEWHFRHDSYEQAAAFAERAALLSERLHGTWLTRSYALQGQALEAAGRLADARSAYQLALSADRRNRAARGGLDRVDQHLGIDSESPRN